MAQGTLAAGSSASSKQLRAAHPTRQRGVGWLDRCSLWQPRAAGFCRWYQRMLFYVQRVCTVQVV